MAWTSWTSREAMPTIWAPPYYTMRMMIPIGTFFLLLQGIAVFLKNLMIALDKKREV
jgi:TRAP-type mannitol/chloroaromatic compound transport system permease small subunit